jgi:hypothetical protein
MAPPEQSAPVVNSSYYTHFMKYLILSLAAITTINAASITAVPGKSIHYPSAVAKDYTIKLDRAFGLHPSSAKTIFHLSSPIADCTKGLKKQYRCGDTLTLTLKPQEIRILNFEVTPRNWKKLTNLQTRTLEDR